MSRSRRRNLGLVVVAVLVAALIPVVGSVRRGTVRSTSPSIAAAGEALVHMPAPGRFARAGGVSVSADHADPDLARAVAFLGQIEDGTLAGLPAELAPGVRQALPRARSLLAGQTPRPGQGRRYRLGGGLTAPPPPVRRRGDEADLQAGIRAAPGSAPAHLKAGDANGGSVHLVGGIQRIEGGPTFAAITWEPGDGPLRIEDATGVGHGLRLHGGDFASVRLNGGLVVPGRTYAIADGLVLSAAVPVGVDIVPLDAVQDIWDDPILVPPAGPG